MTLNVFRRKITLLIGVASVGFVVTFVYALWILGSAAGLDTPQPDENRMRITSTAELIRVFIFEEAGQGPSILSAVPAELVGLSSTELAEAYPHWRLVSFAPERVVVEEACSDLTGGFLRIQGDRLAVFEGSSNGCHREAGAVDIDIESISPLQSAELIRGVPFASESDLALILEGVLAP